MSRVGRKHIAEDRARKTQGQDFVNAALREYKNEDIIGQIVQTQRLPAVPTLDSGYVIEKPMPLHLRIHNVYSGSIRVEKL